MANRLDLSPQSRLRNLAASLSLSEHDADVALKTSAGDTHRAEAILASMVPVSSPLASSRTTATLTPKERIRKAAACLARTPEPLDILSASLTKVLAQPHVERFRTVNVNAGPFKDRVASHGSAGVELLFAVGFEPMHGHLVLQTFNPSLIQIALMALAAEAKSDEYLQAKGRLGRAREQQSAVAQLAEASRARRAAFLDKVPPEPAQGDKSCSSACLITVKVGSEQKVAAKRRFDSENTLADLVNFINSLAEVPEGKVIIENVTTRPPRVLDLVTQCSASLYSLDLWPVAQVRVSALVAA